MTDAKNLLEVIELSRLGTSIPTVTSSRTAVYSLESAVGLLVVDGMTGAEAYDWVRRMNNMYNDGPNVIFVSEGMKVDGDLGFQMDGGSR